MFLAESNFDVSNETSSPVCVPVEISSGAASAPVEEKRSAFASEHLCRHSSWVLQVQKQINI